jgi:hypothetical protein
VQRAREYAEALGTTLTALVELSDIGAENPQPYPYGTRSMARGAVAAAEAGGEPGPIDLEPQRQHVYAQINARFTMAPPRL